MHSLRVAVSGSVMGKQNWPTFHMGKEGTPTDRDTETGSQVSRPLFNAEGHFVSQTTLSRMSAGPGSVALAGGRKQDSKTIKV